MARLPKNPTEKPREWRRRVMVPARMRSSAGWGDTRILNVSSRGLMIQSSHSAALGDLIELRQGDQRILARVVWKRGPHAGLHSETMLPLFDLLSHSEQGAAADETPVPDRRQAPRRRSARESDHYRLRARLFEFAGIATIALSLSVGIATMAVGLLGAGFGAIAAALQ